MQGSAGTLITFLEYPQMEAGTVGAGSMHHVALAVHSPEEQVGVARLPARQKGGVQRGARAGAFHSLYLRDPDGHIVEFATREPGFR